MTVIVSMLLYVFGLDVATGSKKGNELPPNVKLDSHGNIIIYDPYYTPLLNPVRFDSPNIIVPKPITKQTAVTPIFNSSDPAYVS